MKEKLLFVLVLITLGLIGSWVAWLYLQFIGRSPLFQLNTKVLNKKNWWKRRLKPCSGSFRETFDTTVYRKPNYALSITNTQLVQSEVVRLVFRHSKTTLIEYYVHCDDALKFRLTFDLRKDAGYSPHRDASIERALLDILDHHVVERLKRIESL